MQVSAGFPEQLTFEPRDCLELHDAMHAVLQQRSRSFLSSDPQEADTAWLHPAGQALVRLAPESLTNVQRGPQGIWISRAAAREYEALLKAELQNWANASLAGREAVAAVLARLAAPGTVSEDASAGLRGTRANGAVSPAGQPAPAQQAACHTLQLLQVGAVVCKAGCS